MSQSSQPSHCPAPAGLEELLAPLPPDVGRSTRRLVDLLSSLPGLAGTVKPGWRSINFRHGEAGHVCAVFPYSDRIALYFEHGRLLDDPEGLLTGESLKKGRVLRLAPDAPIPEAAIAVFVAEAIALFAR